ncbi:DUF4397 domain-containing protein [Mucilaginibacter sp. dw_454]|uniref:DUF4397 domain-containing protein n=1 Tax=Mucilaginibacter sp. dw_454 TaxID=2720079 RepID=UPI001BD2A146|nr:DUF4397 domain-containing protein [Mucilaginibacter sp. dw_454]
MTAKIKPIFFVFLFCTGVIIVPFIASCGKGANVAPTTSGIQFQVVNVSPDLQPIYLYVGLVKQNLTAYSYSYPSGYFSLSRVDPPIQIKSFNPLIAVDPLITINAELKRNYKYTLFVSGFRADNSVAGIFVTDTAAPPTAGRGKLRFVNASPDSNSFDVFANGTLAFQKQRYKSVTSFIQVPPGNYDFKIIPNGQTSVISDFPNVTIADGKVYTLYCRGLAGGADSVKFGTGIINNR